MSTVQKKSKGKIRIFCCGGAGVNIGSLLEVHRGNTELGFAEIDLCYIDTSLSNLKDNINIKDCYLMEGLDGSGQHRSENHVLIDVRIKAILTQFKPLDLNIVISSASGGKHIA